MVKSSKSNIVLLISIFILLIIAFFPVHYGYFCDELYYISLSKHLSFGFVDVPPLMPLCLAIVRFIFGNSITSIHLMPAAIGVVVLVTTSVVVKRLGGGFFAQFLALISVTLAPQYIAFASLMTYDSFNRLFWTLAIYNLVMLLVSDNKKYWLYFGIAAGLGLMSKFDILWLGAGITIALIFTSQRKYFSSPQFWLCGLIALLIVSPYLIWIVTHDFLTIEYFVNYSHCLSNIGPFKFLKDQIITMNPLTFPLWGLGLYYFIFNTEGRRFKLLGLTYVFIFILCLITHAKFYLITPYYFVLFAGGAVLVEKWVQKTHMNINWLKITYCVLIIVSGLLFVPYVRPILFPRVAVKYTGFLERMGLAIEYRDVSNSLPQWFADCFGWKQMTKEVARVYNSLPIAEREKTVIFSRTYSQASAIDFYKDQYGLPMPISGHDQYYVWGTKKLAIGSNVIVVGHDDDALKVLNVVCSGVLMVGKTYNKYTMDYNNKPIYLCRGFRQSVNIFWKHRKFMSM